MRKFIIIIGIVTLVLASIGVFVVSKGFATKTQEIFYGSYKVDVLVDKVYPNDSSYILHGELNKKQQTGYTLEISKDYVVYDKVNDLHSLSRCVHNPKYQIVGIDDELINNGIVTQGKALKILMDQGEEIGDDAVVLFTSAPVMSNADARGSFESPPEIVVYRINGEYYLNIGGTLLRLIKL